MNKEALEIIEEAAEMLVVLRDKITDGEEMGIDEAQAANHYAQKIFRNILNEKRG
jgi:hypothetical protein